MCTDVRHWWNDGFGNKAHVSAVACPGAVPGDYMGSC